MTRWVSSINNDFTEDVPRYKVLSVGKVMREPSAGLDTSNTVKASAKIDSIIARAAEVDTPFAVVDEAGTPRAPGEQGILAVHLAGSPLFFFDGYLGREGPGWTGDYYLTGDTVEIGATPGAAGV